MSIIDFQRSRFMRATSVVTLVGFLTGCLPGTVKPDGTSGTSSTISGAMSSVMDIANSASGSISAAASTVGLGGFAGQRGMDNRQWTPQDQAGADRAKSIFGQISKPSTADVAVYDPLKPGQEALYKKKIQEITKKYGGKKTLSPEEMLEVSEAVLPVLRFIAKSRMYREGKAIADKQNKKGQHQEVWVPPGGSVELLVQTFCNDHNLPGRAAGDTYSIRSIKDYLPEQLIPAYQDVTRYSSVHPDSYHTAQSLVWHFRHNPCKDELISPDQRKLLNEAASPASLASMNSYCQVEGMKETAGAIATSIASQYSPVDPGTMSQYRTMFAQAKTAYDKANIIANADYTDPSQLLQLADMAGVVPASTNSVLNNPYLRTVGKYAELITPKNPTTPEAQTVAKALDVLNQIGDELPQTQSGQHRNGNYSLLPDGLVAETGLHGPGPGKIVVGNPTNYPVKVDTSGWIASTSDGNGSDRYYPTQRLSVGPMTPTKTTPSAANDGYTEANEDQAEKVLSPLKDQEWQPEINDGPSESEEDCSNLVNRGAVDLSVDMGLAVVKDVVEAIPVLGNVAAGYSAITGHDWMTGAELEPMDRLVSGMKAFWPMGGLIGAGVRGYEIAEKITNRTIAGSKAVNAALWEKDTCVKAVKFINAACAFKPQKGCGKAASALTEAAEGDMGDHRGGASLSDSIFGWANELSK